MQIAKLCSVIAETVGPENEEIDVERRDRWVNSKQLDIDSLRKLFGALDFTARMET